jgi:hypothetical protein
VFTKRVSDIKKQNGLLDGKPEKEISLQGLLKNGRVNIKRIFKKNYGRRINSSASGRDPPIEKMHRNSLLS